MDLRLKKEVKLQYDRKTPTVMANYGQYKVAYNIKKLFYTSLTIFAVSTPAFSENNPVIHIVTEHLPPYQIVSKNDNITGFAVDIIKETMARSHYAYSLNSYSWVRSYKLAQKKANHCIFSIARLQSREKLFKWVGPISHVSNTALWALKGRDIQVSSLNDAKKYTIAVNRDDIAHTGLMERGFNEGEHLYVLDDTKSLVNLLITRPEIDLIVADDITIKFRTEYAGAAIDELQLIYEIKELPLNFFFACSTETDDKVIAHLAEKLASLYQDGSHKAIMDKWRDKLFRPNL
tara:strand:- start:2947 stop:3819 length:873 start_codon:yes stop_codon:yes gene_type:complete